MLPNDMSQIQGRIPSILRRKVRINISPKMYGFQVQGVKAFFNQIFINIHIKEASSSYLKFRSTN